MLDPHIFSSFFVSLIKPQGFFRHRFAQIFFNEKVPTGILNISLSWRLLDEATCYFNLEKQGLAIEEYRIKTAISRHSNFLRGVSCLVPVVDFWCQCIKETIHQESQTFWDDIEDPMTVSSFHCIGHEALSHPWASVRMSWLIWYLNENSHMCKFQVHSTYRFTI